MAGIDHVLHIHQSCLELLKLDPVNFNLVAALENDLNILKTGRNNGRATLTFDEAIVQSVLSAMTTGTLIAASSLPI